MQAKRPVSPAHDIMHKHNNALYEKLACAYFFICSGLAYGIFTSRMPALKMQVEANDAQIGLLLLSFGGASFLGLLSTNTIINRIGSKLSTGIAVICFSFAFMLAALASSFIIMVLFALIAGYFMGLCDVSMNAQAIGYERRFHVSSMGVFHASFSGGAVLGSASGSLFAGFNLSPFINLLVILGLFLLFWVWAYKNGSDNSPPQRSTCARKEKVPLFVYLCGVMSLLCYVSEGSVGEWGSLLLYSAKNAPQSEAALVFAFFSASMVIGRGFTDYLRRVVGDFYLVLAGSIIGAVAMALILLLSSPLLCLVCYSFMGLGFSSIVPILFSRAGSVPGLSPQRASSAMSLLSYSGMLCFPPLLGTLAHQIGLDNALWVIVGTSILLTVLSFNLCKGIDQTIS